MRVIAGQARGVRLVAPKGTQIRPTLDRVRESLFNILAPRVEGARFLDLFAGTGANGIEALSRGAAEAIFVDSDAQSLQCVEENLRRTRLEAGARRLRMVLPRELAALHGPFDLIFADPPYRFPEYAELLEGVSARGLLAAGGLLVVEHERRVELPEAVGNLTRTRQARYGDTLLSFYA
jgi:16S rRNA (guanine(966)-N(2))-methyltransferase RsmD